MSRAHPRVIGKWRERISHTERQPGPQGRGAAVRRCSNGCHRLPSGGLAFSALHEGSGGGAGTVDGAAVLAKLKPGCASLYPRGFDPRRSITGS